MNDKHLPFFIYQMLVLAARRMRREPTLHEKMLWSNLRKKQLGGYKFRRQHIIQTFIVDFYCPAAKLVIEVDGKVHDAQVDYDNHRDEFLKGLGYKVHRITNEQIESEMNKVLLSIYELCEKSVIP